MTDYFVVGPAVTLQGHVLSGEMPRLAVHTSGDVGGSDVCAFCQAGRIRIDCSGVPLPPVARIEALRLLARVADRLGPTGLPLFVAAQSAAEGFAALAEDGFAPCPDGWIRPRGPFLRRCRTRSLEEVYRDPFTIPWNFVPRELECVQPILDRAALSPAPLAVLDLGFGFGKNATFLESRGFEVFGVETSRTATNRTRELVQHPERFHTASATAIPFPDGRFDAVLDVGCLHCIAAEERPAAIREIHRVLRSGGLVSSRVFRPRDPEWVARQPFQADSFGVSEAAAVGMFLPLLDVQIWRDDPDMIYLRGIRDPA